MGVLDQVDKQVDVHAIVFMRCMSAVSDIVSKFATPEFYGPEKEPPGIVEAAAALTNSVISKLGHVDADKMIEEFHKEQEEQQRLAVEERKKERNVATTRVVREQTIDGHHGG